MPDFDQILAEIERPEGRFGVSAIRLGGNGELVLHVGLLALQVGRLGGERGLVDRTHQVGVQKPFLHVRQFGAAFVQRTMAVALKLIVVGEGGLQRLAEPCGGLFRGEAERLEVLNDRRFEVALSPAERWVVIGLMVVSATVVDVLADAAVTLFSPDAFPGDGKVAMLATQ